MRDYRNLKRQGETHGWRYDVCGAEQLPSVSFGGSAFPDKTRHEYTKVVLYTRVELEQRTFGEAGHRNTACLVVTHPSQKLAPVGYRNIILR